MEKRMRKNRLFAALLIALSAAALLTAIVPMLSLASDALTALLRSWGVLPGIGQVFWNTLKMLLMVVVLVTPVSLLITLWMYEHVRGRNLTRVQKLLRGFSRVPTVAAGMVAGGIMGRGPASQSLISMSVLLALMALPFMVSNLDAALRAVPEKYRLAGEALGGQPMQIMRQILLPQALPGIIRAVLMLIERALCEATALLTLMGAVLPDKVLATELFRLAFLGRKDAAVLAFLLMAVMIAIRLTTTRRWRSEREGYRCRYNWW